MRAREDCSFCSFSLCRRWHCALHNGLRVCQVNLLVIQQTINGGALQRAQLVMVALYAVAGAADAGFAGARSPDSIWLSVVKPCSCQLRRMELQ